MSGGCALCGGQCRDADLRPLLTADLLWLWLQAADTADRRGDPRLDEGTVTIRAPEPARQRAAVLGLVPGPPLMPGQSRRVSLAALSAAVRRHGPALTPGAVAAHAAGRQLAERAARRRARSQLENDIDGAITGWAASSPSPAAAAADRILPALRTAGWIARLHAAPDPAGLLRQALAVTDALPLPGETADRRILANDASGNPHALDDGQPLAGLTLALLAAAGAIPPARRPRAAWAAAGVTCDDLTGGLIAVGLYPDGWHLPPGTAVTIPPRELARCRWQASPGASAWAFVTENPSVASAATVLAETGTPVRLLCTSGTPSALEAAAVARLTDAGWRIAVRADFDAAGLAHVTALLAAAPAASPWRMRKDDYEQSLGRGATVPLPQVPDTPWDPFLAAAMRARHLATFEEALMPGLLEDLRRGSAATAVP
jgi:uncharacterized protein (TIGR02679 family)